VNAELILPQHCCEIEGVHAAHDHGSLLAQLMDGWPAGRRAGSYAETGSCVLEPEDCTLTRGEWVLTRTRNWGACLQRRTGAREEMIKWKAFA